MNFIKKVYTMTIILASASPRRQELLRQIGLSFQVIPADLDEGSIEASSPTALVEALAAAKAEHVALRQESADALIIASDTIVVLDDCVMGKPESASDARSMLETLSGRMHEVYTGVTLRQGARIETFSDRSEVTFRTLSEEEIEAYIRTGEPMDKAGAYGIQGFGALFVSELRGDYYNVMGLPLCRLGQALQQFGVSPLGKAESEKE